MNTMNDDKNHPKPQAWIDPALEARIVASVLGETSAFEAAELERAIAENPELGLFKRRIPPGGREAPVVAGAEAEAPGNDRRQSRESEGGGEGVHASPSALVDGSLPDPRGGHIGRWGGLRGVSFVGGSFSNGGRC